ncbi:DUF937 domain-containing protein [Mesonia ostreae]|uniref:DUF937 domain-containing protein n=1 Tax=Mesonia ostreae TaxID=861110 RepID=A0ABU2KH01_9FLAO|nr:DUF937 domain-containing protein [Mesonia ostreae]MDT0293987.1 DUF937 domain-containing protein [Mesonia ostreae]
MSSILDVLKTEAGQNLINGASNEAGVSKEKTGSVLSMALPAILGAMKSNANTTEGKKSLTNALESKEHDGSILSNLGGMLSGGDSGSLLSKGGDILGHVLGGGKESALAGNISKMTGVDASSVIKIIKMAMPLVMGFLGKQKQSSGGGGLMDMLGSAMGTSGDKDASMLESLLDADGDGSVMDDLAGKFLGGDKKGGGGLGGLF